MYFKHVKDAAIMAPPGISINMTMIDSDTVGERNARKGVYAAYLADIAR